MSLFSPEFDADGSWPIETTRRMNRMYRRQRHIYNATRRYYLLGRDQMIARLQPEAFRRWFLIAMILLGIYLSGTALYDVLR